MKNLSETFEQLGINKKQRHFLHSLDWKKIRIHTSKVKLLHASSVIQLTEMNLADATPGSAQASLLTELLSFQVSTVCRIEVPDQTTETELALEVQAGSMLIISAGNNNQLTITEKRSKKSNNGPTLSGVHIIAGHNTQIQYVVVQDRPVDEDVQLRFAEVGRDASLRWHFHFLTAGHNYVSTRTSLKNEQASSELLGTYTTAGHEKLFMDYSVFHHAPHTRSNILVHGIGTDASSSDFIGRIGIDQHATGTDAHLDEHCLLFSEKAQHDTMPILEISTNEVKATHSASITQIDAAYLFYLATRGIPPDQAKRLIIQSFLAEIYERIPATTEQERARKFIEKKYAGEGDYGSEMEKDR